MKKAPVPADPTTKKCTECLSEIPIGAKSALFALRRSSAQLFRYLLKKSMVRCQASLAAASS